MPATVVSSRSLTRMNPRLSVSMPAAARFKRIGVRHAAGGDEQVRPADDLCAAGPYGP